MKDNQENQDVFLSLSVMVHVLGISESTFYRSGIEPDHKKGKNSFYNLRECIQWLVDREAESYASASGSLEEERTRKTKLEADRIQIQIDKMTGKLIETETVERVWSDYIATCKQKILSMASRIAPTLPGDVTDNEQLINKITYEALNELKDFNPEDYAEEGMENFTESPDELEPPAKPDSQPMGRHKKTAK